MRADLDYKLNSTTEFDGRDDHLRVDNTALTPDEVADLTIRHFQLRPS